MPCTDKLAVGGVLHDVAPATWPRCERQLCLIIEHGQRHFERHGWTVADFVAPAWLGIQPCAQASIAICHYWNLLLGAPVFTLGLSSLRLARCRLKCLPPGPHV